MKTKLLNFLVCPVCKERLDLKIFKEENSEIKDGLLLCGCGQFFPIINFIPRMLAGDLRNMLYSQFSSFFSEYKNFLPEEKKNFQIKEESKKKEETSVSFAYEWEKFSEMIKEWKENFNFYFQPIENNDYLREKTVLEIGCGKGRHTFYASKFAKEVVAVDLGKAVDVAFLNNKNSQNIHFIQADIYNLPLKNNFFDFVFCIGVLHHLPTPEQGFKKLANVLKPTGGILIYVYHSFEKGTFKYYLLKFANFFRYFTTKIPHKNLYILCYPIAFLTYLIFILPQKIFFGQHKKSNWPFSGYVGYPFSVILNDTFDRFSAPIENRYSKDQILQWYQKAGLKNIKILGGSGWRLFGSKNSDIILK